jgi:hypothetical protein
MLDPRQPDIGHFRSAEEVDEQGLQSLHLRGGLPAGAGEGQARLDLGGDLGKC